MESMIDTILFDLDGTLLNTLDDLCDSTNFALSHFGYPARTLEEVRGFVGEGVRLLIERALPDGAKDRTDEVLKVFSAHYDVNKENKTKPYDGIAEMLKEVCPRYRTAIVSNKYDKAVADLRNKLFADVTVAVGERAGLRKKPAPDMVEYALQQLHADKHSAVYVGDSDVDVQTARNAGLPIVAVSWGFRDRALLERLGADAIIDRPQQLAAAVQKLNG
jgi:phosphoglycolate phosphatase